jgi:hypothetical protein
MSRPRCGGGRGGAPAGEHGGLALAGERGRSLGLRRWRLRSGISRMIWRTSGPGRTVGRISNSAGRPTRSSSSGLAWGSSACRLAILSVRAHPTGAGGGLRDPARGRAPGSRRGPGAATPIDSTGGARSRSGTIAENAPPHGRVEHEPVTPAHPGAPGETTLAQDARPPLLDPAGGKRPLCMSDRLQPVMLHPRIVASAENL